MNNKYLCNYTIVRFMPYRETREFANIGIVICCPQLGYLDFKIEQSKFKRIFNFFPELEHTVLKQGIKSLSEELKRIRATSQNDNQLYLFAEDTLHQFREIAKHKESIFNFSEPRVILTNDPKLELENIFANAVLRQFAEQKEYKEALMNRSLNHSLVNWKLNQYYRKGILGNDEYSVNFPFIHTLQGNVVKAIKPLDLNKDSSSKVYEHGDEWIAKINRLNKLSCLPIELLFAIDYPTSGNKSIKASDEITHALTELKVQTVPFSSVDRIKDWATVN